MRSKLWTSFFVAAMTIGSAWAQQTRSQSTSPNTHVVRIRTGSYAGSCNPCANSETMVEPRSIISISRSFSDKRKYPDVKLKGKITREDWEDLQHSIDATVLANLIGRIGCPGCADELVEWVEVQFSDGTKKSVSYNEGGAPLAVAAFVQKIKTIGESRLPQQKTHK